MLGWTFGILCKETTSLHTCVVWLFEQWDDTTLSCKCSIGFLFISIKCAAFVRICSSSSGNWYSRKLSLVLSKENIYWNIINFAGKALRNKNVVILKFLWSFIEFIGSSSHHRLLHLVHKCKFNRLNPLYYLFYHGLASATNTYSR